MSVTSVRLQPDVERNLDRTASRQRRSKSWLINQALREYMQREASEDKRWQQTLAALDDVVAGRALPAKTVHAWLKSWGTPAESKPPKARR
ncbi:MAG: CopG family ribbon-helix-helix protein [Rhodanobacteraceae bacterium]